MLEEIFDICETIKKCSGVKHASEMRCNSISHEQESRGGKVSLTHSVVHPTPVLCVREMVVHF